ncbi:MAG: response regulator [Bacteroidota bacterium]
MANRLKILFVDDELVILKAFELVLGSDHDVLTAPSVSDAFKMLDENDDIQVMVSDMRMPESNGLQLLEKVKSIRPEINCYLLTGYEMNPEISSAIEQGTVKRLIKKPIELSQLIEEIQKDF